MGSPEGRERRGREGGEMKERTAETGKGRNGTPLLFVSRSPPLTNSIIWYWPNGGNALRLGR